MRTSAFVRPTEVHYITLHEDLYRICRGNACAAMLMDYFIREHDRRLWEGRVRMDGPHDMPGSVEKWSMTIQASVEFLCDILVWSYSKNTISNAVKKLSEWGMIKITKDRPKGREYDRRHYLTVDQDVVQGLFLDLSKGVMPPSSMEMDFPNLGNQLPDVGKSLEEMKLGIEKEEKGDAAEAAPLPPEELRSLKAKPHSPTPSCDPTPSPCPWYLDHGYSLPENLRTKGCLEAAKAWLQHKREKRQKMTKSAVERAVKRWGREYTPATFVRAVEHSIETGWAGVFPCPEDKGKRDSAHTQPQRDPAAVLYDEIRACRGWPQHMEHDKATDEEKARYASLKAKRKELLQ